jgi:thymidylate synthase (FAD)
MFTKRLVSEGAENYLGLTIPLLDKGYIKLVDYIGTDETVVAAARHSYDKGLDLNDEVGNARLINYLVKNRHTSPLEQCSLAFEVKAPIFVFRQWHRHRTAKLNEQSARYSELPDDYYVPELSRVQAQSKTNKQGSGDALPSDTTQWFVDAVKSGATESFHDYHGALSEDVSKELARIMLPVNVYSKMVWQSDLNNILHFLKLRMDSHAQYEIQVYAKAMAQVVHSAFPKVWAAFDEHVLNSVTLSRTQYQALMKKVESAAA